MRWRADTGARQGPTHIELSHWTRRRHNHSCIAIRIPGVTPPPPISLTAHCSQRFLMAWNGICTLSTYNVAAGQSRPVDVSALRGSALHGTSFKSWNAPYDYENFSFSNSITEPPQSYLAAHYFRDNYQHWSNYFDLCCHYWEIKTIIIRLNAITRQIRNEIIIEFWYTTLKNVIVTQLVGLIGVRS